MNLRKGRNTEKQITCSKQYKQNNLFEPSLARMNCTFVFISGSTQIKIYKTS